MRKNRSIPSSTVIPVLTYPDVRSAVEWLSGTFGFKELVQIGEDHRSQLSVGDGAVIIADTGADRAVPIQGQVTQSVIVRIDGVDAHCEAARLRGARIVMEPTNYDFGERQYSVDDLAGHRWTFSETLADVAPEEWGGTSVGSDT